ncbi:hypothetical protein H2199_005430 [Coniosporium tulheliwenetii]|uniref:Uncharacterized protein n=1 Tax=Coniosporium tulheliwenetii TaxID=3383036 RepID=A0ACC2Z270_9PEZI|nr:hypothetical protein H2199_005430 [Cladosporium sp. JES 115]
MAETLPTPPPELADPPSAPSRDALLDKLDTLLERYLCLLDEYQTARQQLQEHLSAGYISLAQANFNAPRSVRYGRDYYDSRMQATRRVVVSTADNKQTIETKALESTASAADTSPPAANLHDPDAKETKQAESRDADPTQPTQQGKPQPKDPITMFGILTPPALRAAQSSFVKAVEGPGLEVEVGRARKALRKAEG